jgi:hypothetical protein
VGRQVNEPYSWPGYFNYKTCCSPCDHTPFLDGEVSDISWIYCMRVLTEVLRVRTNLALERLTGNSEKE